MEAKQQATKQPNENLLYKKINKIKFKNSKKRSTKTCKRKKFKKKSYLDILFKYCKHKNKNKSIPRCILMNLENKKDKEILRRENLTTRNYQKPSPQ